MKPRWVFSSIEQDKCLNGPFVIIASPTYFKENEQAITKWLNQCTPHWHRKGMVIHFLRRDHLTMFQLAWTDH